MIWTGFTEDGTRFCNHCLHFWDICFLYGFILLLPFTYRPSHWRLRDHMRSCTCDNKHIKWKCVPFALLAEATTYSAATNESNSCTTSLKWLFLIAFISISSSRSQRCRWESGKPTRGKLRHRSELPWLNPSRITRWIKRAKKYRLMTHSLELSWARGDGWSKRDTKEEGKIRFHWKLSTERTYRSSCFVHTLLNCLTRARVH